MNLQEISERHGNYDFKIMGFITDADWDRATLGAAMTVDGVSVEPNS